MILHLESHPSQPFAIANTAKRTSVTDLDSVHLQENFMCLGKIQSKRIKNLKIIGRLLLL